MQTLLLVVLEFPAFSDGRSCSKVQVLRSRLGHTGALRSVGQMLPDQLSHMLRVGFDQLEVSHPVALRWLESGKVAGFGRYYQPIAKSESAVLLYLRRRHVASVRA